MTGYVQEAHAAGCRVVELNPRNEVLGANSRLLAPTLIIDPPAHLKVMCEEVFGPIIPVLGYDSLQDAIAFVNRGPRPLALYFFGDDPRARQQILEQTWSGGVTINDTLIHMIMSDLPFGGVGESGTDGYGGGDAGFKRFTNPKAVYEQGWFNGFWPAVGPALRPRAALVVGCSDHQAQALCEEPYVPTELVISTRDEDA